MKQRLIYLVPFVLAIFLCACSSSTPASTGSASGNGSTATETSNSGTTDTGNKTSNTSAEKPKGLLIGNLKIGKAYSYKSTGTLSCITFTMKLDLIDPDTGEVTDFRTFSSEETRSCTASCPYVGGSTTEVMRNFDSSFTKMTATLDMEDGASHVGWIDESGAFTDVSEKVAASSSFGGLTKHGSPAFVDDYFYYLTV